MVAPLEPLKEWKCSYADCVNSFGSEEQMIAHKKTDHDYYCKICKHDGVDWEDDLRHKINDMVEVIYEGKRRVTEEGKIKRRFKHVVCEFCGEDFKSLGGRELHKKRMHQADQQIVCPGYQMVYDPQERKNVREECGAVFGRASQFVNHIEDGYCRYITIQELERERQHKQIVKQIMMDPETFRKNVQGLKAMEADETESIAAISSIIDTEIEESSGGVDLMSQGDASEARMHLAIEPSKTSLASDDQSRERSLTISSEYQDPLSNAMADITIDSSPSSIDRAAPTGQCPGNISPSTSRYSEDFPAIGFSTSTAVASSTGTLAVNRWATRPNTSATLFPEARPTPPETSAKALAESHKRTQREDARTNLFRSHFWDPTHPDYNIEIFRSAETGTFKCPFSECKHHTDFVIGVDISHHMRSHHSETNKQCKGCNKKFETLTGLVAHYESSERGGKCRVCKNDGYAKFIDEATGGFLSADRVPVDRKNEIWGIKSGRTLGDGLDVNGDEDNPRGVRTHKYEAKLPNSDIRW